MKINRFKAKNSEKIRRNIISLKELRVSVLTFRDGVVK